MKADLAYFEQDRFWGQRPEPYQTQVVADILMAEAINRLLADPARLDEMRACCCRAARVLNWETEATKLLAAYPQKRKWAAA